MDALQKLLFPRANVRGETVVLGDALEQAVVNQNLPVAARRLAGEMAAAALLTLTGQLPCKLRATVPFAVPWRKCAPAMPSA